MGTPDFAVPSLKLLAEHHTILAVYSQPPRPNGRGMIIKASNESKIYLKESYVVGDRKIDIDAGLKAGCKTIFVNTSQR